MKKNILVIFGGKSTEHDISILTGCQVANALNKNYYNILPLYITKQGKWHCDNRLLDINFCAHFNPKFAREVTVLPSDNWLYKRTCLGYKKMAKIHCAIVCCHGKNGEDGSVQGLLELAGIPYTSSGILGSCVGLDKIAMKHMFKANKVPICKYFALQKSEFEQGGVDWVLKNIKLPVIVKPNTLGSSIGISVVSNHSQLEDALNTAFLFDDKVVIEALVQNLQEVNISVLGDGANCVCSTTEQPTNASEFLTFADKYLRSSKNAPKVANNFASNGPGKSTNEHMSMRCGENKSTQALQCSENEVTNKKMLQCGENKNVDTNALQCGKCENIDHNKNVETGCKLNQNGMQSASRIMPANITKQQDKKIRHLAQKVFALLDCKGVVRIDFLIDKTTQNVYVNEINTIPGSFAFYLWEQSGIRFDVLLDKLILIATNHHKKQSLYTTNFATSVLSATNSIEK